jgi:probable rRNA maturation factor
MAARRLPSRPDPAACAAVAIAMPCRRWRAALPAVERVAKAAARAALDGARAPAGEISLVLGDDALVRTLNRRWRGQDRATNVLSFPSGERRRGAKPLLLGDVVLAYGTVAREAAAQEKPLSDHLVHLVTHGVLHLVGFDHEDEGEARRMEGLERRVLAGLGVPDPYRERERIDG